MIPALRFLVSSAAKSEKRILGIWDFRSQPYSIGDLVILQEVTLALCYQYQVRSVDVCLLAEAHEPARPSFAALNVNSSNYLEHILALFPVILAGRHVAELHFFDSHRSLAKYVADNAHRYHIWPPGPTYAMGKDLNSVSLAFIAKFYEEHHFVPSLSFRPGLIDWANSFLAQHVLPNVPVVVQLRNAGWYNPFRNSTMDAWIEFFLYCLDRFPTRFVVICAKPEVDERLRSLNNVVIAKDFDTTVDQDLALVQCAAAYMGMSSGPSTVAIYGNRPYSIINAPMGHWPTKMIVKHSWGISFVFANEHQRCIPRAETPQLLIDEFSHLFSAIDVASWQSFTPSKGSSDDVPLRLR